MICRLKNWWNRPPQRFSGGVLINYFGWQILRIFWLNFWRRIAFYKVPKDVKSFAEVLKREGVVLIPNFLSEEVYREIRREYEKESKNVRMKPLASKYIIPSSGKTRVAFGKFTPDQNSHLYNLLDTHLIKNEFLRRLGSTIVRHDIGSYREPQIFINKKMGDEYPDLNSDIYYHADVPYPGVKAFYYLSDTDEENGALIYAKGSHKLTLKRLALEYRKSIEFAGNIKREEGDKTGRAWHCLSREEERHEGIRGTSMAGKANSIVIFNVMGFHRRGDFGRDLLREFVLTYYRE